MAQPTSDITGLLKRASAGDRLAEDQLFEEVHGELKRIAGAVLSGWRPNHSWNPTALVNELFLRFPRHDLAWRDRQHFYSTCARAMRRTLVDYSRYWAATKRPKPNERVEFDKAAIFLAGVERNPEESLAIDAALDDLAHFDAKLAELVELRYFGGFTTKEIAGLFNCCERTVTRDWEFARVWLHRRLNEPAARTAVGA